MITGTPGFHYPEGLAPFGEMDIVLPHSQHPGERLSPVIEFVSDDIFKNAWGHSDWLAREVSVETALELADENVYHTNPDVRGIILRAFRSRTESLAFAVAPPADGSVSMSSLRLIRPDQLRGLANGKLDVSGTMLARTYKRWRRPERVYGCVSNVNVDPAYQGQKIGAALFTGILSGLPPEKKATVYAARSNGGLLQKLGQLGYRETGFRSRNDLIEGATIQEVRLQADSVGEVRENLARRYRWLNDAELIH